MQRKVMTIGVVASVLALMIAGMSLAAQNGGGGRQRGGDRGVGADRGPGGFDPAQRDQMRQRMMEGMKRRLEVDDQAWKVMEPRLQKVMQLNMQMNSGRGGMMGMFGGMRGRGGPEGGPQGGPQGDRRGPMGPMGPMGDQTALQKETAKLQTLLESESTSADEIKKQLTVVRQAREKAKQELAAAQQDLKQILTVKQEALLVTMGQLD
ncbi:MAG: hypothetical protein MUC88_09275 [Planctomycetes bacterium]|nr:hypothetical protein [Planctomycetota bacterium]